MPSAFHQFRAICRIIAVHPLTQRHRAAAIVRVIRWQIASRLRKGKITVPFIGQTRLRVSRSMTGATGNIYVGLHEFRDMAYTLHLLRPDDTFFDVGANVGSYTVLAAGVCQARVVAFEPAESTFASLTENVSANLLGDRVTVVRSAVGRERGSIRFTRSYDTLNHVMTDAGGDGVDVPLCPLDDFADRKPLALKVDVEGFEDSVIAGAARLLGDPNLRSVIIEARYCADAQGVHQTLLAHGFGLCDYDPFDRKLTRVELADAEAENGIYVRDFDFVAGRLRSAPAFTVLGQTI